jgi:hypothetical protein
MMCPDLSARLKTKNLKGNPMKAVIFKTLNAVFEFDPKEVIEIILRNRSKYDLDQVANLQDLISTGCEEIIVIPEEPVYFDSIALDLIRTGTGNGSVFCKTCNKRYSVKQLKSIKVGGGAKPLFIRQKKRKGIKRFFKKRRKPPSMCGGEGYTCPEDHDLISLITWKTF